MTDDTETKPLDIPLLPVEGSSNIAAMGYDPATKRLAVKFTNGGVYTYENVAPEDHAAFAGADSPGKHFHSSIRGAFKSTKHG